MLERQDVLDGSAATRAQEWLLANGLGGSSSGTARGDLTRRSQACLTACGPHGRLTTLLLKCEERLIAGRETHELGCNLLADGTERPAGHRLIESFELAPWPTWRYRAGSVLLEKSLFLVPGHNAVATLYRHIEGPRARIIVSPLLVHRGPHDPPDPAAAGPASVQAAPGRVRVETTGGAEITLWHDGQFLPARAERSLHYPEERRHGTMAGERAFVPGYLEAEIGPGVPLHMVVSAESDLFRALAREDRLGAPPPRTLAGCIEILEREERGRLETLRARTLAGAAATARQARSAHRAIDPEHEEAPAHAADDWTATLAGALLSGLARRGHRATLVATLPDAVERPADALRALHGIVALRGFEIAREVLRGQLEYVSEGLLPESFDPDDGTPRYGDPAPALWLVIAGERYARRSEDVEFARGTLYPAVEAIMHFYRSGTRHAVRVDADGLLAAGLSGVKRADVNALWYQAQVAAGQLARVAERRENAAFYLAWARAHHERFNAALWDERDGCLYREIGADGPVRGLEPSQVLAVSLGPPLLDPDRARRLVETLERERFTPLGLRAAPGAARFETAWLGPFLTAYLRVHERAAEAQERCARWLDALRRAQSGAGVGHLPEAFLETPGALEGARPARIAGAPLSVVGAAELLRFRIEEFDPETSPAPAGHEA